MFSTIATRNCSRVHFERNKNGTFTFIGHAKYSSFVCARVLNEEEEEKTFFDFNKIVRKRIYLYPEFRIALKDDQG